MSVESADISVVICAYTEERWADLVAAVDSIKCQTLRPREVIVVIDHNLSLFARVQAGIPGVIAIENNETRGLSGARNSGISISGAELIAFLDDDAVADPDWLEWLARSFEDPHIMGASGRVDPVWLGDKPVWFPGEFYWVLGCTYVGLPGKTEAVRNLYGGCSCIRRQVFEVVGGFRSEIGRIGTRPLGGEETELCIRVRQHWTESIFLYEPRARIHHKIPASRASWRYFLSRCYAEGLSKAVISRFVGARDGLASERAYTLRTLPRGMGRGVTDALVRRELSGLWRAAAIMLGLAVTTFGYAVGAAGKIIRPPLVPHPGSSASRHPANLLAHSVETVERVQRLPDSGSGEFEESAIKNREPLAHGVRPLRVLQVTARYFPYTGGVETHVYEVSRRMSRDGVDVTVLTTDPSGNLPAEEDVDGVHIKRVRAWPANRDYYFAPAVWSSIVRGDWDIIHCQCYHTFVTPLAMLAARRAGIPYVLTFHSGGHSSKLRNSIRRIQHASLRPLLARADKLIGVSRFEADFFRDRLHIPGEHFAVIQNGSHLPQRKGTLLHTDEELIVSVGRLEQYKGHHRLLTALPLILAQRPQVRARIAGTGPYESRLRLLAQQLGIADRVEIAGIPPGDREGMADLLSKASLVVLLSDYEAHPVSVMEALSLERPVLVTNTSGLKELADRGMVRSIPLSSSPVEIAEAAIRELDQPMVRATVELPTWDGCASELVKQYVEIVQRRQCAS